MNNLKECKRLIIKELIIKEMRNNLEEVHSVLDNNIKFNSSDVLFKARRNIELFMALTVDMENEEE